jgi:hypothetical protein
MNIPHKRKDKIKLNIMKKARIRIPQHCYMRKSPKDSYNLTLQLSRIRNAFRLENSRIGRFMKDNTSIIDLYGNTKLGLDRQLLHISPKWCKIFDAKLSVKEIREEKHFFITRKLDMVEIRNMLSISIDPGKAEPNEKMNEVICMNQTDVHPSKTLK